MREAKFLAGLATILVFAGIFCFKALRPKKYYKEDGSLVNTTVNYKNKIILIVAGVVCIIAGIFLFVKAFKHI